MAKTEDSELVRAAAALEQDLRRLEELSAAVRTIRLHNEKSITRAARELNEALEQPGRLAQGLKLLAEAMAHLQERQEAAMNPLSVRAAEIQARAAKLNEYVQHFAALGAQTADASKLLQTAQGPDAAEALDDETRSHTLAEVDERLTSIVEGSRALAESARGDDLPDFARDADALKQRIQALSERLKAAVIH
jgi:chromosome segregation ATPase